MSRPESNVGQFCHAADSLGSRSRSSLRVLHFSLDEYLWSSRNVQVQSSHHLTGKNQLLYTDRAYHPWWENRGWQKTNGSSATTVESVILAKPGEGKFLADYAKIIRWKNAGPFELTFDIIFDSLDTLNWVRQQEVLTRKKLAELYEIKEEDVIACLFFEPAKAFKSTIPRKHSSGLLYDGDVHENPTPCAVNECFPVRGACRICIAYTFTHFISMTSE